MQQESLVLPKQLFEGGRNKNRSW